MLNECQFIGNLGAAPEVRTMQSGDEVVKFSLAVTEKWKDKDGNRQEKTEWVRCVVFSKGLVGICKQYLDKGSKVFVKGKIQTRDWEDSNGIKKYSTEIVLQGFDSKLVMLDSKSVSGSHPDTGSGGNHIDTEDEIPF